MIEKIKVFVAEDDQSVLLSLKKLLVISGFKVEGTPAATEVVDQIKTFLPDIILLDLRMPELDGFQICELLKGEVETKNIPIIMLSGFVGEEEIKRAKELGVVDFFSKPYNYLTLVSLINKVLAANKDRVQKEK
jgi:two-component system, cell cycle response regulator